MKHSLISYELVSAALFFFLNPQTGQKGREVIWGEENSWLLFLSWFSSFGITDLFHFFFICPNPEQKGMLLRAFLNAPNVYDFLCKEPGLENKNRRVLKEEGSGRWLKWGPEGHRWEMGGECMLGGMWWDGSHTWFLLLWLLCFSCLTLLCCNFMGYPWSIQGLMLRPHTKLCTRAKSFVKFSDLAN